MVIDCEFEVFQWEEFDNVVPWNRYETKTNANQVLANTKWEAFSNFSSNFHHDELENPFKGINDEEHFVREESF